MPNDWKWTLVQTWNYQESYDTGRKDASGNAIYDWRAASPVNAYNKTGDCGNNCAATGTGQTRNWKLTVEWKDAANQENGKQGEFRGPHYDGWREELQSGSPYDGYPIRYSDERIWKPGTPGYKPEYEKKFGANLIWWSTQDSAFENWATLEGWDPRARRVDNNVDGEGKEDLVWGENGNNQGGPKVRDRDLEIQPTGDITNGLIRVGDSDPYRNSNNPGRATLGEELKWENGKWVDHHNTKTRIFGHYHLAWADQEKGQIQPVSLNSYSGARSFVAQVKNKLAVSSKQQRTVGGKSYMHEFWSDLESPPNEYSIGAVPTTLKYVQYGRVTTKLDLADGENLLDNGFLRAPLTYKNDPNGVDHYFFRGVNATSIEQMAALPSDAVFQYSGHALMYGINNRFHGITGDANNVGGGHSLPNALGFDQAKMGLGNFVDATFNVGQKKVTGDVYNAWLQSLDKPTVLKDKLVHFQGDVIGNTIIGTADRAYIPGNDEAAFRGAFFGENADEMGGAFNSVKPDDKYGSAYEYGDWGGVFGAAKTGGSGGNTFQGDDSNNVYGNNNP